MNHFTIYHNPRCSKSREALDLLQSHSIQPIIIEYLKAPLSFEQLKKLRVHLDLKHLVRCDEPLFKELKLKLDDEDVVLHALSKSPILMQRPIITYGEYAIIGRPAGNVLNLINLFNKRS